MAGSAPRRPPAARDSTRAPTTRTADERACDQSDRYHQAVAGRRNGPTPNECRSIGSGRRLEASHTDARVDRSAARCEPRQPPRQVPVTELISLLPSDRPTRSGTAHAWAATRSGMCDRDRRVVSIPIGFDCASCRCRGGPEVSWSLRVTEHLGTVGFAVTVGVALHVADLRLTSDDVELLDANPCCER